MPAYKYQPYYSYFGPSHSEPFREKLSADEIERRLELFFSEIGIFFDGIDAVIKTIDSDTISITTALTQQDCDARVKKCLNNLDLYAKKI